MICRSVFSALLVGMVASAYAADERAKAETDQDDPIGRKLSDRVGPFVQTGYFYHADADLLTAWRKKYEKLTIEEKVDYCVFQLRNESWSEAFPVWSDKPYSKEPEGTASQELVKLGRAAIPQLLRALDSRVSTKMYPSRHMLRNPWRVQDAALDTIEHIACRDFGEAGLYKVSGVEEQDRKTLCKSITDWWEKNKGSDEVQWAKEVLFSKTSVIHRSRRMAIDSLYHRLGKKSYRLLVKAYQRLHKGREDEEWFDETKAIKEQILYWLLEAPTKNENTVFVGAIQDAPLAIRLLGAKGLWAIGDSRGLEAMIKETEERLLKHFGSSSLDMEYYNLVSFFVRCNAQSSREAIYKCLSGPNPYLRQEAIRAVPSLHMEKAVRALPEVFDDPFVLAGSHQSGDGKTEWTVPPRRVCDEAAETFTKLVPDAPKFDGTTAETQQQSIKKLKQWWKENSSRLKWDEKRGMLTIPKKE
ncbi:MAG: hypothetical protein ACLP9L_00080 [Thermoguttaceae bacterium]